MESSSSITFADMKTAVGFYLGITGDESSWTASELAEVLRDINQGLRMVYTPPILPGQSGPHRWRFMRPTMSLTTVADQGDYAAPDDFGGFHGRASYEPDEGLWPIDVVDESQIRAARQAPVSTSRPRYMASRHTAGTDAAAGQRFVILLHPTPDAEYLLTFRYVAIPPVLSADRPYPLGGALHGQMFLDACLAAAEKRIRGAHGAQYDSFLRSLAASVLLDAGTAPETLGYNGDRSDDRDLRPMDNRNIRVTYNGIQY